jgi:hypothetical protein
MPVKDNVWFVLSMRLRIVKQPAKTILLAYKSYLVANEKNMVDRIELLNIFFPVVTNMVSEVCIRTQQILKSYLHYSENWLF